MTEDGKRWLWEVYNHARASSRETLHSYFRGPTKKDDLTAEITNMLSKAVRSLVSSEAPSGALYDLSDDPSSGCIIDKPQCAVYLYYLVAEHILQQLFPLQAPLPPVPGDAGARRFKGLIRAAHNPDCYELISSAEFHMPLIECALYLVAFMTQASEQHYPRISEHLQRTEHAAGLWWAAGKFLEYFTPSSTAELSMPEDVQQYLQQLQTKVLDRPLMATGSLLFNIIQHGGGGACKSGDKSLVYEVLQVYATQAIERAQLVGWYVQTQQQPQQPGQQQQQQQLLPDTFHEQCAWLMDKLVLDHLELCFGQHMSVVVACVVYVAAKLVQVNITFKRITEVLLVCSASTSPAAFLSAEISPGVLSQDGSHVQQPQYGDVRMFYNTRFLPALDADVRQYMQDYQQFLQSNEQRGMKEESSQDQVAAVPVTPPTNSRQPLTGLTLNAFTQPTTTAWPVPGEADSAVQHPADKQRGAVPLEGAENTARIAREAAAVAASRASPTLKASDNNNNVVTNARTLRSMR